MRSLAVITDLSSAARFQRHRGEPTEPPTGAPARDPPYRRGSVVRRRQTGQPPAQRELFWEHEHCYPQAVQHAATAQLCAETQRQGTVAIRAS